jgi:hypothetical protein
MRRLIRERPELAGPVVASALVSNLPTGSLPHSPTRLEQLAELAGVDADLLRDWLWTQVEAAEQAWRAELARALQGEPEQA